MRVAELKFIRYIFNISHRRHVRNHIIQKSHKIRTCIYEIAS
jgi:hypothetical protein